MKYSAWTTHEIRRLRAMHEVCRAPSLKAMGEAFPRHPPDSVHEMARRLNLRSYRENRVPFARAQFWLRVAHEYFGRRERGLLKIVSLGLFFGIAAGFLIGQAQAETGIASHYHEGKWTASGERFRPDAMTCAHRRHPFGSILRVRLSGRAVECRVNDRGPFIKGRIIDLSRGSARALGLHGIARVTVERVR